MYPVCSRSFYQKHLSTGDNEVLHSITYVEDDGYTTIVGMADPHWPYPCEVANSVRGELVDGQG
jgi:hypothetical protein